MTVTGNDETLLLSTDALNSESPSYVTDAFRLFIESIEQALSDDGDIAQIETCLNLLAVHDPSFKYRQVQEKNENMTGYVWHPGVKRRDFQLYFGAPPFVDRLGRPLNDKVDRL
jgi:hypothetical protein